ncbi:hypothetical protein [Pseudomonas sp. YL-218 TE3947]|jgi:hypothetical protein|uniref:hypothetical protein n=1 Tax=Pseudomonas TaxID=286 RepID=UPI003D1C36F4
MDAEVMAFMQAYINTLDVQKFLEAEDVECLGLLPDEEDENPYADLYEDII